MLGGELRGHAEVSAAEAPRASGIGPDTRDDDARVVGESSLRSDSDAVAVALRRLPRTEFSKLEALIQSETDRRTGRGGTGAAPFFDSEAAFPADRCRKILDGLETAKDAEWFRSPVAGRALGWSKSQVEYYRAVVPTPMDLETLRDNLDAGARATHPGGCFTGTSTWGGRDHRET